MIGGAVIEALQKFVPQKNIHLQEPMAGHTTFRIGGPADCLLEVENEEQLKKLCRYLGMTGVPFFVLGNGSNLLVNDTGYRGIILEIGQKMSSIIVEGNRIVAKAGATIAQVARAALEHALTGLEFAAGIPGTVGGGVVMNAGAYGGELCQVLASVTALEPDGTRRVFPAAECHFGYRKSRFSDGRRLILEAAFALEPGDEHTIKARMEDLAARRREKQPLEYPSAGSTFKRPQGYFAAALIEDCGLKGASVGGAQVSEKHAGFVINRGGATAEDILRLMDHVRETVQRQTGVTLEPEVKLLGF